MADKNKIPFDLEPANHMSAREFADYGGRKLVYVRAVIARDVLDDPAIDEDFSMIDIPGDTMLYAVHSADGECLALVGDRDTAFAAARQHEMQPLSVH